MKRLLLIMLAVVCCFCANAAPAYPGLITVKQKDGSEISFYLHGDEHFSYSSSEDGYLLVKNVNDVFEYATIHDGTTFVSTGVKAHNVAHRSSKERNFITSLPKVDALLAQLNEMRDLNIQREQSRMPAAAGQRRYPLSGTPKGIIILVSYSDVAFKTSPSVFQNMATQHDYNGNGGTGSIKDYFSEVSFNQFTPDFDVYGPYTLPENRKYYGGATSQQHDQNADRMIIDACNKALEAGVNFAKYDNDSDGIVDNIFVYFAGHNQAEGGGDDCIWPHRSSVSTSQKFSGKTISDYACTSEYSYASGSNVCGIGTFCHEFSHVLGLPDFYDTKYSNGVSAMGNWDIMTNGNYNNSGRTPPTYTAYERFYIGWLTPTALTNDTTVDCEGSYKLKSLISSNKAYLVSATQHNLSGRNPNPKEFFMLEYRKVEGRDTKSGLADGLLVTHINYQPSKWAANGPNTDKNSMGYFPVLPGKTGETNIASGKSKDVYPYSSYDYCDFVLHGASDAMIRKLMNIINEDTCVSFDYMTPNEKIKLAVHDVEANLQPVETQFAVHGSGVYEELTAKVTNTTEFRVRVHTEDGSNQYMTSVKLAVDTTTGVILDTLVDVMYTPTSVTYDKYSETKFQVAGTVSKNLTQVVKFSYRNRRPVYITAPVAYEAKDVDAGSALLSWSFVADTAAGTPNIEKYGAKYYLDVYNMSDQPQTETEDFEAFPDKILDDWSANFTTYSEQYRKSGQRSAVFSSADDTIYSKVYSSDITKVAFWLNSIRGEGKFRAELQHASTGKWEKIEDIQITKSTQGKDCNYEGLPEGYNRLRLFFMPTDGTIAIDDISVTTSKSMNYVTKSMYLKDTTFTVSGLETGKSYKYVVRATDKDEAAKTPRYENISDSSNVVEFTAQKGGGGGQKSEDGKLVTSYNPETGETMVSIPELKSYDKDGKHLDYALFVYNTSGTLVYKTAVTSNVVYIPRLGTGVYLVKYTADGKSQKDDPYGKIVIYKK